MKLSPYSKIVEKDALARNPRTPRTGTINLEKAELSEHSLWGSKMKSNHETTKNFGQPNSARKTEL